WRQHAQLQQPRLLQSRRWRLQRESWRGRARGGGGGGGGPVNHFSNYQTLLWRMKTLAHGFLFSLGNVLESLGQSSLALISLLSLVLPVGAANTGKTFATAQEAVSALAAATARYDHDALHDLFGPAGADLENPDRVQGTNELNNFTAALNQTNRLARLS